MHSRLGSVVVRLAWTGLVLGGCGAPGEEGLGAKSSAALVVAPDYRQEAELWGDAGDAPDGIGRTVVISGDTIAAAAPYSTSSPVHLFQRVNRSWVMEARLVHPDGLSGIGFGVSLALDGRVLLVGAPGEGDGGVVYVYSRRAGLWTLVQRIEGPGGQFGRAVALRGDTAVVGAPSEDGHGAAYVLVRCRGRFRMAARLVSSAPMDDDAFGTSVAMDGDTMVVGAPNLGPVPTEPGRGAIHVFRGSGALWTEEAVLFPADAQAGHAAGSSVAVSGDLIVAGNDLFLPVAHVFRRSAAGWVEEAELSGVGSEPTGIFGHSVAVSGDLVVVGAPWDRHQTTPVAGQAFLFRWTGSAWTQSELLDSDDARTEAEGFGHAVAIDGRTVVVGAPKDDENGIDSGAAYVFRIR